MVTTNYLDFWDVFVNELAGSPAMFLAIGIAVILYIAVMARFPNAATIMIVSLFLIVLSYYIPILWPFVALGIPVFFGWQVARLIQR
mgnify:CR=1 FL=1|tara:strand:- start:2279 stop:2539 length:261 start_codon:yes stop_codon:yes gene_type:complete